MCISYCHLICVVLSSMICLCLNFLEKVPFWNCWMLVLFLPLFSIILISELFNCCKLFNLIVFPVVLTFDNDESIISLLCWEYFFSLKILQYTVLSSISFCSHVEYEYSKFFRSAVLKFQMDFLFISSSPFS